MPRFMASPLAALTELMNLLATDVSSAFRLNDVRSGTAIIIKMAAMLMVTISSMSVKPL